MKAEFETILEYHQASKHNFKAYAPGPRQLDMLIKPDLFLNYHGTELLLLDRWSEEEIEAEFFPAYEQAFSPEKLEPSELNMENISRLFFDSFAISAWKKAGATKWPLRVNPSSGNLHPTEVYLFSGSIMGLLNTPFVCHYAPLPHALELRAQLSEETWKSLSSGFPKGTFFVALTSIYWRVSWKYGLRAFRYANHDIGHAIAALSFAAAGLGWKTSLLADMGSEEIAELLGITEREGPEREEPVCLLAVYPAGENCTNAKISSAAISAFKDVSWEGVPNSLSPKHIEWVGIDKAASATQKKETAYFDFKKKEERVPDLQVASHVTVSSSSRVSDLQTPSLRGVIHKRRSAIEMDNSAYMEKEIFYRILRNTLPEANPIFNTLAFGSFTHLLLFVNRVKDLLPGLYVFLRKPKEKERFKAAIMPDFLWTKPENCPPEFEFYLLMEETLYDFAAQLSCGQRKAADACFTACMISEFEEPLNKFGSWIYPYLFWECGILGQLLYLEAEANGFRGCGIGCFFDDPLHEAIGLKGFEYQDLYHFSVGSNLQEIGSVTLPGYKE
jgi:SagB-type dehydrogenase family enzyme